MMLKNIYRCLGAVLMGAACVACASDEPRPDTPDQGNAKVGITISAASLGSKTRAFSDDELLEGTPSYNELIVNWFVAFCHKDGGLTKVDRVVTGKPGGGGTGNPTGVWNDRVQTEIPRGTYTVIAFANMDNDKLAEKFAVGTPLPAAWKDEVWDKAFTEKDNSRIPMSGYREDVQINQTVNEEFAIEVVRMLSKVEFAIKNESQQSITISGISLTPVYNGDIYLFPDYTAYGGAGRPVQDTQSPTTPPRFPQEIGPDDVETYTMNPTNNNVLAKDAVVRNNFYIKESLSSPHPTDHFHIALTLKRWDATEEQVLYSLADDNLKFFYRNDYVLFPILISDYMPVIRVYDYPPIGGYPVEVEDNGTEFYANFQYSGSFDIEACLVNTAGTVVVVKPKEKGTDTDYVECIIPDDMKDRLTLTYDPAEMRWHGDFNKTDAATEPLKVILKFHIKSASGELVYTRTLYLLSK